MPEKLRSCLVALLELIFRTPWSLTDIVWCIMRFLYLLSLTNNLHEFVFCNLIFKFRQPVLTNNTVTSHNGAQTQYTPVPILPPFSHLQVHLKLNFSIPGTHTIKQTQIKQNHRRMTVSLKPIMLTMRTTLIANKIMNPIPSPIMSVKIINLVIPQMQMSICSIQ